MNIICIEGIDSVGKETVSKMLKKSLEILGYKVATQDFPRYDTTCGILLRKILNGEFGNATKLDPNLMGAVTTLDRIKYFKESYTDLNKLGFDFLILDRSFYSNFIHQCSKLLMDNLSYVAYEDYYDSEGNPRSKGDFKKIWIDENFKYIEDNVIPWMIRNYKMEFIDSGLVNDYCMYTSYRHYFPNIYTFVLRMDQKDHDKLISMKENKDDNEIDLDYQNKCRLFIDIMNREDIKDNIVLSMKKLRYTYNQMITGVTKAYFDDVNMIDVKLGHNKEEIDVINGETVDTILNILADKDMINKDPLIRKSGTFEDCLGIDTSTMEHLFTLHYDGEDMILKEDVAGLLKDSEPRIDIDLKSNAIFYRNCTYVDCRIRIASEIANSVIHHITMENDCTYKDAFGDKEPSDLYLSITIPKSLITICTISYPKSETIWYKDIISKINLEHKLLDQILLLLLKTDYLRNAVSTWRNSDDTMLYIHLYTNGDVKVWRDVDNGKD